MHDAQPPSSTYPALGLIAAGVMLLQIGLTRVFSFVTWHHLGFMVISVALLGFAVSGILLQLWPDLGTPPARRAGLAAQLAGAGMVLALALVALLPFDPTRLSEDPLQLLQLLTVYAVLLLPFTGAGLAVVVLLGGYPAQVGRLYASDLLGAGLGSLLAVAGLSLWGAVGTVLAAGALCALAGGLLSSGRLRVSALVLVGALLIAVPLADRLVPLHPTSQKALGYYLDPEIYPQSECTFTAWNAISRVDVIERSGRVSWSETAASPDPGPTQTLILIDGDAATPILHAAPDAALSCLDYTLSSAAPQALHPERALVIGSGGGIDVLTALHHGAQRVDAVEVNPVIAGLVSASPYADQGGDLFARPEVHLQVEDGRSYVRGSDARYDLIQLSLIDTWAASMSGAYSLSEGYLYTVEAFQDYLTHLTPDGALSMTRWLGQPPRECLRVCAVAAAALEELGVRDPGAHIVVLRSGRLANTLVKRAPFTPAELNELVRVARERSFQFVHLPGGEAPNDISRFLRAPDPAGFLADYSSDVSPTHDDNPFFFQFARWRDLLDLGQAWRRGNTSGRSLLLVVLLQAGVLSALLLVAPLLRRRRRGDRPGARVPWAALGYFAAIGLGFMLLEVSLMQRFTLYVGHPTYAFALVLTALLVGAGIGSALASRLTPFRRARGAFLALLGGIFLHAWAVPGLLDATLHLGIASRVALSAATLLPLGVTLGIPFPLAMSRLAREGRLVGWAWAANGCTSVVGPVLAVLLAIDLGFTTVALTAAGAYAAAWALLPLVASPDPT